MSAAEIDVVLDQAAETGTVLEVTKKDGRTFVGVPEPVEGEALTFKIKTGRRGRPAVVHVDDVEGVSNAA